MVTGRCRAAGKSAAPAGGAPLAATAGSRNAPSHSTCVTSWAGFITFCLNWKHTAGLGRLAPTEREGTSVETVLFTIVENKIVRFDVADNTLDLAIYEWDRGWAIPHNIPPQPMVTGVDRREATPAPQLVP